MTISRFIHVAVNGVISFSLMAELRFHYVCVHASFDRHLGCFHVLTTVNSAAVNTGPHASF